MHAKWEVRPLLLACNTWSLRHLTELRGKYFRLVRTGTVDVKSLNLESLLQWPDCSNLCKKAKHFFSPQDEKSVFSTLWVLMVSGETSIHGYDWFCGIQIIFVNNKDCTSASRQKLSSSLAFSDISLIVFTSSPLHLCQFYPMLFEAETLELQRSVQDTEAY